MGPLASSIPSWGEIGSITAIVGVLVTWFVGYVGRVKIDAKSEAGFETAAKNTDAVSLKIDALKNELNEHKIIVAQRYASIEMLDRFEAKFFAAISEVSGLIRELSARIDRKIDSHKE
jgi:hypothetical protein